jgi:hypothetical protein
MQRSLTDGEIKIIQDLPPDKFLMNRDAYPAAFLNGKDSSWKFGYANIMNAFDDIDESWIVYNAGVQVAKISAWKMLYDHWKDLSATMFKNWDHHGAGQALFNYIIQKNNMVVESPVDFHNAHWFSGTPATIKGRSLYVGDNLVAFNHHKFSYTPDF